MNEAIIVALITASASVLCQIIISNKQKRETETAQAVRDKEFDDRLKVIEHKLDEHNGYAEKLSDIAIAIVKLQKDVEYLKGRN